MTGLKQYFDNTEVLFKNVLTIVILLFFYYFNGKALKAGTQENYIGRIQNYIILP